MEKSEILAHIEELEAVINSGGFEQFFFNSTGEKSIKILQALKSLGDEYTHQVESQLTEQRESTTSGNDKIEQ